MSEKVKVTVVNAVNILVDGGGVRLEVGQEVELPDEQAEQLANLGYVKLAQPAKKEPEEPDGAKAPKEK